MSALSSIDFAARPVVYGVDELHVGPSSIDLHLGNEFAVPHTDDNARSVPIPVDVADKSTYPEYDFYEIEDGQAVQIPPLGFALGTTVEVVDCPADMMAVVHGRSSVGRLGLFVHNAGLIDAGFHGEVTLEFFNAATYPIRIRPGMRICQITYHLHESTPPVDYSAEGKYQNQTGPTPSELWRDFE
jgi:dCTP deaminase